MQNLAFEPKLKSVKDKFYLEIQHLTFSGKGKKISNFFKAAIMKKCWQSRLPPPWFSQDSECVLFEFKHCTEFIQFVLVMAEIYALFNLVCHKHCYDYSFVKLLYFDHKK